MSIEIFEQTIGGTRRRGLKPRLPVEPHSVFVVIRNRSFCSAGSPDPAVEIRRSQPILSQVFSPYFGGGSNRASRNIILL